MVKAKIYMLPSWTGDNDHMTNLFMRQTSNSSGIWKNIEVTRNIKDADYYIQMDRPKDPLRFPSKTIYMNWEPKAKGSYYLCDDYDVYKRILFEDEGNHFSAMWFLDYTYDELLSLRPFNKIKKMSCVLSNYKRCDGHATRHNFAKHMAEKYPDNISMYGTVARCPEFKNIPVNEADANLITRLGKRGNFVCKRKALIDYKYNLTMENSVYKNYFTEKIVDALLMWCLPIYWGAPNVTDFIDGCVIEFDATNLDEVDRIKKITDDDNTYYSALDKIGEARKKILNQYNFCNVISKAID